MYHVSAQGVDERMINVHYRYHSKIRVHSEHSRYMDESQLQEAAEDPVTIQRTPPSPSVPSPPPPPQHTCRPNCTYGHGQEVEMTARFTERTRLSLCSAIKKKERKKERKKEPKKKKKKKSQKKRKKERKKGDCLVPLLTYFVPDPCLFLHSVFLLFSFFLSLLLLFVVCSFFFFRQQMLACSGHKGTNSLRAQERCQSRGGRPGLRTP